MIDVQLTGKKQGNHLAGNSHSFFGQGEMTVPPLTIQKRVQHQNQNFIFATKLKENISLTKPEN